MKDAQVRLYHLLPVPLRSLAAGARGLYLRAWRYGKETEKWVEEALARETWSAEEWARWQDDRLARLLHRAALRVPFYREQWSRRRRKGDRSCWDVLDKWPILEKESIRESPRAFVADDCDTARMFCEQTSGTTGTPLRLWWSRRTVRRWYALFEARCRRWHGVSRHDRWAILGGQHILPAARSRPPFWVWNGGLNQLYMSSFHLSPASIPHYLDALQSHRIAYLYGYSSSLYALAAEAVRLGRKVRLKVAITNAEALFDYQRQTISEAFQCPVRETYGMAEIVAAASECENQKLHLWPDAGVVEMIRNGEAVAGAAGQVLGTGLVNIDMPLIRYRVGDRGRIGAGASICSCGRSLPVLDSIDGRDDDVLYTADGRMIGRLDPVFKTDMAIREAQIVQESLQRVKIRYVPAPEFSDDTARMMVRRLQHRMGPVEVILEAAESLPRERNGKFRAVVCNLSGAEKAPLQCEPNH